MNNDFETVYWVLAHEYAHIYFNHVTILNNISIIISQIIPIFGPALSRSREYSCDRFAQIITGTKGLPGFMVLVAGRRHYPHLNIEAYIENAKKEKGFFLWYTNLMASHPIPLKRVPALEAENSNNGKLF
jgi:Zn-dependent protease with chaperone function